MIYIQIPKDDNAVGFLALAKSGSLCRVLAGKHLWRLVRTLNAAQTKAHSFQEIEEQYRSSTKTHRELFNTEILNAEGVR